MTQMRQTTYFEVPPPLIVFDDDQNKAIKYGVRSTYEKPSHSHSHAKRVVATMGMTVIMIIIMHHHDVKEPSHWRRSRSGQSLPQIITVSPLAKNEANMPASAGRVRMPHNNRVAAAAALKTTAIWQKTIGHDPYAGQNEPEQQQSELESEQAREKARQVMTVARQQNLTDGAQRDDFARRLYLGLKSGKRRKEDDDERHQQQQRAATAAADNPDEQLSSSEDELVEVEVRRKKKSKKERKKRKKRRRHSSSDDESRASVDDDDRRREKRKKSKKRKSHRSRSRRRHSSSDDSSRSASGDGAESSSDHEEREKKRKRRKEAKHRTRKRRHSDSEESQDDDREPREKRVAGHETKGLIGASFQPSEQYSGAREGFVFQMGDRGIGYYKDRPPAVNAKLRDEMLRLYRE
jgi:hypothetical protein